MLGQTNRGSKEAGGTAGIPKKGMDEDAGMLGHITRDARLLEMPCAVLPGALRAEDG